MPKLSFISTNFATDVLFSSSLPPLASSFEIKEDIEITCKYNPLILIDIKKL